MLDVMDAGGPSLPRRTSLRSWDDTSLSLLDYGGAGQRIVFLHGLAGHAGEWTDVVSRMAMETRRVAFDQRGHGQSSRRPSGVSRADYVADVVAVINQFAQGQVPVNLVGQSLGGHTAMLVAARHPDLVAKLVMVEATPEGPSAIAGEQEAARPRRSAYFARPSLRSTQGRSGSRPSASRMIPSRTAARASMARG